MGRVAKRVLTGTALGLGAAILLFANRHAPTGVIAWGAATVFALLGARELGALGSLRERRLGIPLVVAALVASGLAWVLLVTSSPWASADDAFRLLLTVALAAALVALAFRFVTAPRAKGDLRWTFGGTLWCVAPLFGLVAIDVRWGTAGLVALVICAKIGDIFGYLVGRKIGRRHPFPGISPGKTVAGCVSSLLAGAVAGAILALLDTPVPGAGWLAGAVSGLVMNLAAQAGDLLESWVKRTAGVKDSSTLVGPAGGILDVLDSLFLSVPCALLLWPLLFSAAPVG